MKKLYDAYDLKREYEAKHPDQHFFDPDTLKFFGERMSEMNLLKRTVQIKDYDGIVHTCYVLSSRQRSPYGGVSREYHYFDVETYDVVEGS